MPRICYNRLMRGMKEPTDAWIYALADPLTAEIFYVGKTTCNPRERLHLHLSEARRGIATPKARLLRELLDNHLEPVLIPMLQVPYPEWPAAESDCMEQLRALGCKLLNVASSGGGP